jgi:poly(3-hydroxybutyrate) depolymerase
MGFGTRAYSLIAVTFLISTLPACTTCVGSGDQPAPRAHRSAKKRSHRTREKVTRRTVQVGDAQRRYIVQTPRNHSKGAQTPLLVLFTGTGQTPERFTDRKNITAGAAKLGYLLAVPAARGAWKHELCQISGEVAAAAQGDTTQGKPAAPVPASAGPSQQAKGAADGKPSTPDAAAEAGEENDDLKFFVQMLEQLTKDYAADPHRTYMIGVGEGAAFAERVARELPVKVSGVASVGSTATCDRSTEDQPARPVTALIIDDAEGGPDAAQPASGSTAYWFRANQCPGELAVGSKVDVSCAKGSRLRHVVVDDLRRGWAVKVGRKYTMRYIHEFFGGA